jgi:HEPN domain-containing protein
MVKGYLFSKGIEAPKTHKLRKLCEMCEEFESGFSSFNREATTLSRYGVLPRYPNELELEEHDAETAIKYADKIMEFVNGLL